MTRLADAVYRLLLLAFPRRTRAAHGEDMVGVFAAQRRAFAGRPAALVVLWVHAAIDAMRHGLASRWRDRDVAGVAPARWLSELPQNVLYALRTMRRAPGFTAVAIVTLALGIGSSSAIFTVVHGVLREPLPFPDAERLHRLRLRQPDGNAGDLLSAGDFMSLRERSRVLDRVEAFTNGAVTMVGAGDPQEVRATSVSDGLFTLLDLPVTLGRPFDQQDHRPGGSGVAVLDHGFWQRVFGGDPRVLGRRVSIGGGTYAIVGVLGPGAGLPADAPGTRLSGVADLYLPIAYDDAFSAATTTRRSSKYLVVFGRVRADATRARIDDDLRRVSAELAAAFPESNAGLSIDAIGAREHIVGDVRTPLLTLLGAVALVLLVACANVASLMLARGSAREGELAVRAALGAGRGRLLRQLLTEAVVLAVAGGAAGLALATWAVRILMAAQPPGLPRIGELAVDGTVVLFTFGVALLASVVFGAAPALQATGRRSTETLRAGGRGGGADRRARRARATLVVAEIALAVVLLTGAGLFIRSVDAMLRVNPAFHAEHALSFRVALFGRGYDPDRVRARVSEFETELGALPGVRAVAATSVLPVSGPGSVLPFRVDGAPSPPTGLNPEIGVVSVTPEYFRAIGASLTSGRPFTDRDRDQAPPVAILNAAAARRWFPNADPVGQRVWTDGVREVVGVVDDMLQGDPRQPTAPQLFVPYAQRPTRGVRVVLRTDGDPLALAPAIRATALKLDPNLAVADLVPLTQVRAAPVAQSRFYTMLLTAFASIALALAAIGVYGVMSCAVAERRREISLRMALGARLGDVLRMVVGGALMLALAGGALGTIAALAVGRLVRHQLYSVGVFDPLTLVIVCAVLLSSAVAASALPARRAARLDPGDALRQG